jgi:methylphosphotriester-DNA--protein-cysteine methyltransferase
MHEPHSPASPPPAYRLGPYREYAPEPALARIVEVAWTHTPAQGASTASTPAHRVLPENGVSIGVQCIRRADGRILHAELLLIGPVRRTRLYTAARGEHLEALRLRPEWCRSVLGIDPAEHTDALTPFTEIYGRAAAVWVDIVARTRSSQDAVDALGAMLHERVRTAAVDRGTRIAHGALQRVRQERRTMSAIARQLGVTERHARRVVRHAIGTGAKHFERVHRLNAVVGAADRVEHPNWARLATAAGFCDQPHFIATCQSLTGLAPTALHRERQLQHTGDMS